MHLLPAYWTTTNHKKRKKKKKLTASMEKSLIAHEKFLKKMGVRGRSAGGRASGLQSEGQEFDSPRLHQNDPFPLSNTIPVGTTPKKEIVEHNFTIAPAYNKGAYQVISKNNIKDIGR